MIKHILYVAVVNVVAFFLGSIVVTFGLAYYYGLFRTNGFEQATGKKVNAVEVGVHHMWISYDRLEAENIYELGVRKNWANDWETVEKREPDFYDFSVVIFGNYNDGSTNIFMGSLETQKRLNIVKITHKPETPEQMYKRAKSIIEA
jgi:hypothetical protein